MSGSKATAWSARSFRLQDDPDYVPDDEDDDDDLDDEDDEDDGDEDEGDDDDVETWQVGRSLDFSS